MTSLNPPTHEENAIAFSRSLRAFHSNQQVKKSPISFNTAKKSNRFHPAAAF
jgi:hypothetical protein